MPTLRKTSRRAPIHPGDPRLKISPEQLERIRSGTESCRALAREFGVSHVAISYARRKITHLDPPETD